MAINTTTRAYDAVNYPNWLNSSPLDTDDIFATLPTVQQEKSLDELETEMIEQLIEDGAFEPIESKGMVGPAWYGLYNNSDLL